jgi:aminoglycoside phosphotransferase family enzyme/predicted kinase
MTIPGCQAETAAFLRELTGAAPVETHISAVFVGEHEALKLKKAVNLPFLDFTARAARAAMARRELELNRVAAPEIYLGVQAVIHGSNGLRLAPDGTDGAIDYVVRMARLEPQDFLDETARRGGLDAKLLDALGDAVAALHAKLPPILNWDSPAGMKWIIEGNASAAESAGLPPAEVQAWLAGALAALDGIADSLQQRVASGFLRRAHGDLHLGNLCLWHGVPTAFDMLEFDEALATIDLGYDLAFLLMDLQFHAGRDAANRVLNRYVARTGDYGLLAGLPCFLSTRAMVRAHVQASRGKPDEARHYLDMAMAALRPSRAVLVAVGGLQGTGKTTLARAVAPGLGRTPGALILRSDEIRKRLHGVAPEQKLPVSAYGDAANRETNAALVAAAEAALRGGQGVIADSTFLRADLRVEIEAVANRGGVDFFGIWLEADLTTLVSRVAARTGDASDAGPEVVRQAALVDTGDITWRRLAADDLTEAVRVVNALTRVPQP